jgi:pyruvate dehydrogenase E2 component (dihydrolipoamide acetyltransferase)
MSVVIQMPKLGHTMTEGTVLHWHKHEGDSVKAGEPVLTVETDKAEVEVEALASGVLAKCVAAEGAVIPVGGALAIITAPGEELPADVASSAKPADGAPRAVPPSGAAKQRTASAQSSGGARRVAASPRAKRLATERGVDLAAMVGTGADGLITEDDVRSALDRGASVPSSATPQVAAPGALAPSRVQKLTRIQQVGARNLTASWQQVPHFVQMARVDMSRALAARKALGGSGVRITVTDVILAATVAALKENPRINASYRDGELHIYDEINLGVAVDTPDGLIVPVIHGAGTLDLASLSARANELAQRARDKKLRPADLEGATFTVSNLGAYGVETGTPVIFAPQLALMFVGAIRDDVVAIDGRPEVRPVMQLSIAYDHRGLDGATASRFTTRVKELLETAAFLGMATQPEANAVGPARPREVAIEAVGDSLRTEVRHAGFKWMLSGDDDVGPNPVTAFLGALGSCLLMSLRVAARARNLPVGRSVVVARSNERGHVKEIEVELQVETSADDDKLHRLVELAERGCHVRAMIRDEVAFKLTLTRLR